MRSLWAWVQTDPLWAGLPFCYWKNDGKKDVLCGEDTGKIYLLINSGTPSAPVFNSAILLTNGTSPLNVYRLARPVAVDWDRDGKKDLVVATGNGNIYFFKNRGTDAAPVLNGYEIFQAG